jgi:hypothetical protein
MNNQDVTAERHAWRLKELAAAYGLSVSFLRKEIRAGRLAARRAGAAVLVLDRDFQRYLEGPMGEGQPDEIKTHAM